jgi:hypothetical protein
MGQSDDDGLINVTNHVPVRNESHRQKYLRAVRYLRERSLWVLDGKPARWSSDLADVDVRKVWDMRFPAWKNTAVGRKPREITS